MAKDRCIVESCGRKLINGQCPAKHDQFTGQMEYIKCAHDNCAHPAIIRVKDRAGWANICLNHYDHRSKQEAKDFCQAIGIKTVKEAREAVKKLLPSIGKGKGIDHWRQIVKDHLNGDTFPAITLEFAYAAINREIPKDSEIEVEF